MQIGLQRDLAVVRVIKLFVHALASVQPFVT